MTKPKRTTRRPPKPEDPRPVVDLSLDFDFWVREKWEWDWGHNEGTEGMSALMTTVMWQHRYAGGAPDFDLVAETDPATHADFVPWRLVEKLSAKGCAFDHVASIGAALGHESAYAFFRGARGGPPAALLQLDAHHDCFDTGRQGMHCGNWLGQYYCAEHPHTQVLQLYPKWKDPTEDGEPQSPAPPTILQWKDWSGFPMPHRVRHIFFCQSPGWTPPHLDRAFADLVKSVGILTGVQPRQLGPLMDRTILYEQGMAERPAMQQRFAEFRAEQERKWAERQKEVAP